VRTREQERVRKAQYRARKRAEVAGDATILDMRARPGRVEAGVRAELALLSAAAERPGLTEIALRLGAILDDQDAIVHHAAAAPVLDAVLGRLHDASRGHSGGKLLALREARREE
jgi:hypothetical protein